MNDLQPIPTHRLILITLITAFIALIIFSQVIANPTEERQASNVDQPGVGSIPEGIRDTPETFEAVDNSEINIVSKHDTAVYYFLVSVSSVFTGILVGVVMSITFVFYINRSEIRNFVNNAFEINGLEGRIRSHGKTGEFSTRDGVYQSSIQLFGFRKQRVKFILPVTEYINPLEFGLRNEKTYASTTCDLELLPLKLRVISEYFKELHN